VQYVTDNEFVGRAAEKAAHLKPAALPVEFRGDPHAYLEQLNHVRLVTTTGAELSTAVNLAECALREQYASAPVCEVKCCSLRGRLTSRLRARWLAGCCLQ
jgi:hypothetical protein